MSEPSEGGLACKGCIHGKTSSCLHPDFEKRKLKPLIIAEEGTVYPPFCPLPDKYRR